MTILIALLGVILWYLSGLLGWKIFNDYLNRKYPLAKGPMIFGDYLVSVFGLFALILNFHYFFKCRS